MRCADCDDYGRMHEALRLCASAPYDAVRMLEPLLRLERTPQVREQVGAVYKNAGRTLAHARDFDAAIDCYDRAIALDPLDERALTGLLSVYAAKPDPEKGIALGSFIGSRFPGNVEAKGHLGRCYLSAGDMRSAAATLQELIDAYEPRPLPSRRAVMETWALKRRKEERRQRLAEDLLVLDALCLLPGIYAQLGDARSAARAGWQAVTKGFSLLVRPHL